MTAAKVVRRIRDDERARARPDPFARLRERGAVQVAQALGLEVTEGRARWSLGPCPCCYAVRRSESRRCDRRGPIGLASDGRGWRCHRCGAHGDPVTLAALVVCRGQVPPKGDERWAALLMTCRERGLI